MSRNFGDDEESQALLRSLAQQGLHARGAVVAYQGMYPIFQGYTNIGMLFTRQRALSFHENEARAWGRFSGLQITAPRGRYDRPSLQLARGGGYSQLIATNGAKFWVDASWDDAIAEWLQENPAPSK